MLKLIREKIVTSEDFAEIFQKTDLCLDDFVCEQPTDLDEAFRWELDMIDSLRRHHIAAYHLNKHLHSLKERKAFLAKHPELYSFISEKIINDKIRELSTVRTRVLMLQVLSKSLLQLDEVKDESYRIFLQMLMSQPANMMMDLLLTDRFVDTIFSVCDRKIIIETFFTDEDEILIKPDEPRPRFTVTLDHIEAPNEDVNTALKAVMSHIFHCQLDISEEEFQNASFEEQLGLLPLGEKQIVFTMSPRMVWHFLTLVIISIFSRSFVVLHFQPPEEFSQFVKTLVEAINQLTSAGGKIAVYQSVLLLSALCQVKDEVGAKAIMELITALREKPSSDAEAVKETAQRLRALVGEEKEAPTEQ